MNRRLNGIFRTLQGRFIAVRNLPHAYGDGEPRAGGASPSSLDTAARTLRSEDTKLLGMSVDQG